MITSTCPNCLFTVSSEKMKTRKNDGMPRIFIEYTCQNCGCEFEDVMIFEDTNILKEGALPRLSSNQIVSKFGPNTEFIYRMAIAEFTTLTYPIEEAKDILAQGEYSDAMRMLAGWLDDDKKQMAKDFVRQLYHDFYNS